VKHALKAFGRIVAKVYLAGSDDRAEAAPLPAARSVEA
jgi:hypothetical protein